MYQTAPLSEKECHRVKKIAKELTEKMQDILVTDWSKKQRSKAKAKI
ncbi:MAG: hypothetical protein ABJK37_09330 [Paraglaciecola sp.]